MNSYGKFLCKHTVNKKDLGYQNGYLLKVIFQCTFQRHCKTYPQHFQLQYKSRSLDNKQILPLNLISIPMHAD